MGRKKYGSAARGFGRGSPRADFFRAPSPIESIGDGVRKKSPGGSSPRVAEQDYFLPLSGSSQMQWYLGDLAGIWGISGWYLGDLGGIWGIWLVSGRS